MKQHFIGATYDLTQENMNHLIEQLDYALSKIKYLEECIEILEEENKFLIASLNVHDVIG
jgi:hypothetical protein